MQQHHHQFIMTAMESARDWEQNTNTVMFILGNKIENNMIFMLVSLAWKVLFVCLCVCLFVDIIIIMTAMESGRDWEQDDIYARVSQKWVYMATKSAPAQEKGEKHGERKIPNQSCVFFTFGDCHRETFT